MDSALKLRIMHDENVDLTKDEINKLMQSSELLNHLTSEFIPKPLYAIWRIIALSEIPYTGQLPYTKKLVDYIESHLGTPYGFTLTGKGSDFVPCYNAMLITAFSKLGLTHSQTVQNGVKWIKQYQRFERNSPTLWKESGIKKYGGCLEKTPCFIGIAKSVQAAVYYDQAVMGSDKEIKELISRGMDYLLMHELYKRLSNQEPITKHILDLAFPASYQLNIVELLEITQLTGHIKDNQCKSAIDFIKSKMHDKNFWKINYQYKADGYISFDKRGQKGEWITYLLNKLI